MGHGLQDIETKEPLVFDQQVWVSSSLQDQIEQERLAAIQQLAGGLAHHINNSLQIIIGSAELAGDRPDVPDSIKKDLDHITQAGKKLAWFVRQLVDFCHYPGGEKTLINITAVVREFEQQLAHCLPDNIQVKVEIEPGCEVLAVRANSDQIEQILTNLTLNAQEAMPTGGELRLSLFCLPAKQGQQLFFPPPLSKDWVALTVSDTGTGIAEENLPYIFEPFFTTKEIDQGIGLGLAQVYGLVKQLCGDIVVSSRPGEGTTFTLYLPNQSIAEVT